MERGLETGGEGGVLVTYVYLVVDFSGWVGKCTCQWISSGSSCFLCYRAAAVVFWQSGGLFDRFEGGFLCGLVSVHG